MNNLLLKSYLRCKRKAWLDLWGTKSLQTWSAQKSIHLITEFNNFNKLTGGNLFYGIKACEIGFKGVIGLKIKDEIKKDLNIEIKPSLLIKTKGNSIWGNYKYLPVISKLGRRTTREHQIDLALCSIVLEKFQKAKVEYGLITSNYGNKFNTEKIFINKRLRDKSINLFSELKASLKENIPDITNNRKKCSICSWKEFCDNEAKLNGFLTDIDGIGTKTAEYLKNAGIFNIEQLSSIKNSELNSFQVNNIEEINKLINQSKSYSSGIPIRKKKLNNSSELFLKIKKGFFVLDIESDPDERNDFLYGFLSVNNIYDKYENYLYKPILNLINSNNKIFNLEILKEINTREDWPILHYGETEKISIIKIAKLYNLSDIEIEKLKSRMIDLHFLIRDSWILPLKNYSLKTVANWVGFNWSQKNVSGSKALFWWIQYKINKQDSFLEKIINYNKDDCIATLEIAKWYLKNLNNFSKEI